MVLFSKLCFLFRGVFLVVDALCSFRSFSFFPDRSLLIELIVPIDSITVSVQIFKDRKRKQNNLKDHRVRTPRTSFHHACMQSDVRVQSVSYHIQMGEE